MIILIIIIINNYFLWKIYRLAVDMGKGVNREFRGFFDCLKKIIKHEGVRGLY